MSISHWPASERPREKLLQRGAASLSNAELLAIFLRTGVRGKDAVHLARDLLAAFGGLRALLNADTSKLDHITGMGPAKTALLHAALELGRRYLEAGLGRGPGLGSSSDTKAYLQATLRDRRIEVFACLYLDTRHRVLAYEELFRGTLNGSAVYPREVIKSALAHHAAAVILVHNHPSGVAEPSAADLELTRRLKEALALVDIRVLDHLIIGEGEPVSLCERGVL